MSIRITHDRKDLTLDNAVYTDLALADINDLLKSSKGF
jgi:hypothetical protein